MVRVPVAARLVMRRVRMVSDDVTTGRATHAAKPMSTARGEG